MLCWTVLLIVPSCKKEDTRPAIPKIKTQTGGGNTGTYTYDDQGRCTQVAWSSTGYVYSYLYSSNTVTYSRSVPGQPTLTTVYYLNNDGYAVSDDKGNTFTFDSRGYRTSAFYPADTTSTSFTWVNGDCVSVSYNGGTPPVATYTYLPSSINTIGNESMGVGFWGKSSQHLIDEYTFNYQGSTTAYQYSYVFDAYGRVSKATNSEVGGSLVQALTYTYY